MDSTPSQKNLLRLRCSVQNYDWGLKGHDSRVARLYAQNSGSETRPDIPYAELWMGTHESGPSFVVQAPRASNGVSVDDDVGVSLKKWISENPNVLGDKVLHNWGCDLPFLFKVLSMAKASSIQAHPNKELARTLHKAQPDVYKDNNHKPEMALAITEFEALCGFISLEVRKLTDKELLVLRLEKQYPADVGVISAFFFNYVKLNPGEALYLGADEPHAYVSGECIECMATSDNVVRAGLTPKHRDVKTLCSMLTYKQGFPEILQGVPLNSYVRRYLPPFNEFMVDRCILPYRASTVFPAVLGPSIFLVMAGEGIMHAGSFKGELVTEGDVLFAPANTEISIESESEFSYIELE
ncbi:mannose-6-phosphate isomerase 2-like isoform X2 [Castanea sativa]|uniref:mannose-6-phosphate isomerase 2-like isoform X2 n=1 Tax=Castanea sativa TaxID=21020 RepID=UPI003F65206D